MDHIATHALAAEEGAIILCIFSVENVELFNLEGWLCFVDADLHGLHRAGCVPAGCQCYVLLQTQKKRVESILAEEATIDGLENVEVKVFK